MSPTIEEVDIMNWGRCEKHFIRKTEVDTHRMTSLKEKALKRLKRIESSKITSENVSFIVEDYYEIIKELLIVYLLKDGLKSSNHQCLISYFYKKNPNLEKEAYLIAQMSFFRNRLTYYGEDIPMEFYQKNNNDFKKIIKMILEMVK